MTGVPLEQLKKSEMTKLVNLEKNLGRRVIGQQAAVTAVAQAIRRSRAGIADPNRPIGSFIFLGPTGVGKTELAKVLAEEVFGSRNNLIKVDMSEFGERHTVARLVGAPAGYVGYDDGGWLTEKVRRQPYSVILFDEIEKAHPDVFNILLQILEDGVLTDGHGKKADFRNSVVILTSNIGATEMAGDTVGFAVDGETSTEVQDNNKREAVMKALRNTMRPELLNRFDQIVMFNSLGQKEVGSIFDLLTTDLNQRLTNKGIALLITPRLKRHLVEQGYDDKYGARPLRRVIQNELERPIAIKLLLVRSARRYCAGGLEKRCGSSNDKITVRAVRRRTTTKVTRPNLLRYNSNMAKAKSRFVCQQCGASFPKWAGRCDNCGAWNSLLETVPEPSGKSAVARSVGQKIAAERIRDVKVDQVSTRIDTGIADLNQVLGGGLMPGGVTLIAGQPGIGKSTILMQLAAYISKDKPVLYASGEESASQVKLRAERLGAASSDNLYLTSTTSADDVAATISSGDYQVAIVTQCRRCQWQKLLAPQVLSARLLIAPISLFGRLRRLIHLLF